VSTYDQAETVFDEPLRLRYTELDPAARYKVRVSYGAARGRIRLTANGTTQIHDYLDKSTLPLVAEFEIPQEATRTGTLTLEWSRPVGGGGAGGGNQVSEVWLVREGAK
jgi:hypothetical protein